MKIHWLVNNDVYDIYILMFFYMFGHLCVRIQEGVEEFFQAICNNKILICTDHQTNCSKLKFHIGKSNFIFECTSNKCGSDCSASVNILDIFTLL